MCDHLLVSDHLSKTTIFSLSNLVSNCNQFLGWQFNNVSLFLSLCKWPLNAWFVPYVRWMCYTTFINRVRKESLVSTWNYTYCNLEIARYESLSKCRCFQTFLGRDSCGSILVIDRLPLSNHLIFAVWVVIFGRLRL